MTPHPVAMYSLTGPPPVPSSAPFPTVTGMRPLVPILVALLLLLPAPGRAATMVSIAAAKVNLRAGPGKHYPVLWELGAGYPLRVLGRRGNWLKVKDFEGDVGWVYRKLTNRRPHLVVKKRIINIRSGPGTTYKIVAKARRGVVFATLKRKGRWVKLKHETGLVGWARRDLLWGW